LTTLSAVAEAVTGTGRDLSGGLWGLVDFWRLLDFLGSSFGTTMDVSSWRMRMVKQQSAARQEGNRVRCQSPQRDQYHAGKNPAWQVTKDKVETSRAKLALGQEAPE
jgi:hypothetical protein